MKKLTQAIALIALLALMPGRAPAAEGYWEWTCNQLFPGLLPSANAREFDKRAGIGQYLERTPDQIPLVRSPGYATPWEVPADTVYGLTLQSYYEWRLRLHDSDLTNPPPSPISFTLSIAVTNDFHDCTTNFLRTEGIVGQMHTTLPTNGNLAVSYSIAYGTTGYGCDDHVWLSVVTNFESDCTGTNTPTTVPITPLPINWSNLTNCSGSSITTNDVFAFTWEPQSNSTYAVQYAWGMGTNGWGTAAEIIPPPPAVLSTNPMVYLTCGPAAQTLFWRVVKLDWVNDDIAKIDAILSATNDPGGFIAYAPSTDTSTCTNCPSVPPSPSMMSFSPQMQAAASLYEIYQSFSNGIPAFIYPPGYVESLEASAGLLFDQ